MRITAERWASAMDAILAITHISEDNNGYATVGWEWERLVIG